MCKAYLAARYSRHAEMEQKARELDFNGIEVTSRWIYGNHEFHKTTDEREADFNRRCADDDIEDILAADLFIAFTEEPNDDWSYSRGGRHWEAGFAHGNGKEVHIIGPRENVFYYISDVTQWDSWKQFIDEFVYPTYGKDSFEEMMSS